MKGRITLGAVGGVDIVVGLSWLAVMPLVAVGIFAGIDPGSGSTLSRVVVAGGGSLLFGVSVVVHELGHVAAAHSHGIVVESVVVFLLGGYSKIDLDEARPEQEWTVAAAGPLVSALLGFVLLLAAMVAPVGGGVAGTLRLLAVINGGVAAFNLIPAFPLDGGRMLRASLLRRGRSSSQAQRIATRAGIVLGSGIMIGGVALSLLGSAAALVAIPTGLLVLVMAATARSPGRPISVAEEI